MVVLLIWSRLETQAKAPFTFGSLVAVVRLKCRMEGLPI
jgi:hypothetical protein